MFFFLYPVLYQNALKDQYAVHRGTDVTQTRTRVFPQCCYGAGSRTLCVYAHFSIAITRGSRHNTKVREPFRGCDSDFRNLRAMCSREMTVRFSRHIIMAVVDHVTIFHMKSFITKQVKRHC